MTHARTLTRYACLAGLIAGLLAPVSSLAVGTGTSITETTRFNSYAGGHYVQTPSATHVYVRATGKWTRLPDGVTRYQSHVVPVARSTLRTGALSALSRGVTHPAFSIALIAAGFAIEMIDGTPTVVTREGVDFSSHPEFSQTAPAGYYYSCIGPSPICYNRLYSSPGALFVYADSLYSDQCSTCFTTGHSVSGSGVFWQGCSRPRPHQPDYVQCIDYEVEFYLVQQNPSYSVHDSTSNTTSTPVSESDIGQVDPYIEPELAEQLWNGDPIPEWQEAISVIGIPATDVQSKGQDMPEVARKIGQWGANMDAQYQGEEAPYPDTSTGGQTADDEMVDMWNQPIPNFPEAEPEWQVEEITTLPDFSFGLGAGSCPAPVTIPHPLGGSFTIEFQKFCDLASMIRGAVIAICMILSLYIVLGTRATTS